MMMAKSSVNGFLICFLLSVAFSVYVDKVKAAQNAKEYCVAIYGITPDKDLKIATEAACKQVSSCAEIRQGGKCFLPNTPLSHASYALNKLFREKNACNLHIAALTMTNPSYGNCTYP